MIVRCIHNKLSEEQLKSCCRNFKANNYWLLTPGKDYLVFAVDICINSSYYGSIVLYDVLDDEDNLVGVPNILFSITDGSVSKYWVAEQWEEGVNFRPRLYSEHRYFHQHLADGVKEIKEAFLELKVRMERESRNRGIGGHDTR